MEGMVEGQGGSRGVVVLMGLGVMRMGGGMVVGCCGDGRVVLMLMPCGARVLYV